MIGKAVIKAHMQTFFIIILFSDHHVESIINLLERYLPFLKNSLSQSLEKQKNKLFHHSNEIESKSIIASIWEIIITLMIIFFLYSIINSVVNEHLKNKYEEENDLEDSNNYPYRSNDSKNNRSNKSNKLNKSNKSKTEIGNKKQYLKFN